LFLQFDKMAPLGSYDLNRDGTMFAVALADQAIHLYDLPSGTFHKRVPTERMPSRMTFDHTGRHLALYHGEYRNAAILDLATEASVPAFGDAVIEWSAAWTPDGRMLVGAGAGLLHLWDAEAHRSVGVLRGQEVVITHVDVSSDGRWVISRSWDDTSIAWDLATREPIFRTKGNLTRFTNDGGAITGWMPLHTAAGRHHRVTIQTLLGNDVCRLISGRSNAEALTVNQPTFVLTDELLLNAIIDNTHPELSRLCAIDGVSANQVAEFDLGKVCIASLDPTAQLLTAYVENEGLFGWPVVGNGAAMRLESPRPIVRGQWISCAISGDSQSVAYCETSGQISVISIHGQTPISQFECDPSLAVLALSSDGRLVILGSWHRRSVEIWNVSSKRRVATLASSAWTHASFSPDNRRVATGDSESLSLWDIASEARVAEMVGVHACTIFSPEGRMVASALEDRVRLYDAQSLEEICTLESPRKYPTTGLAFTSDGTRLVQMSNRAGIGCIWNLPLVRERLAEVKLDWDSPPGAYGKDAAK
jgi:WD40 repeat protein